MKKIDYCNNIKIYAGNGGNCFMNILKYIRCNDEIKKILKKYKVNNKYIGVHFRNTDRINNINTFLDKIKIYKDKQIYIATDNIISFNTFKTELKNYNLFFYNEPYDAGGNNIHFNDPNKEKMIMSIIIDIYMLYHSDIFIDSPNSLVSKLIKYMRNKQESIFD